MPLAEGSNWPILLEVAVRHFGWTPAEFWDARPFEIQACLLNCGQAHAMSEDVSVDRLRELMDLFPSEKGQSL